MPKTSRNNHRRSRIASHEEDGVSGPSYFEWREQTVRMPAVSPAAQPSQSGVIVRLLRRIAGKA